MSVSVKWLVMAGVLLLLSGMASGADLEAGRKAYESGDYETALGEFRPLAEQGIAEAQVSLAHMYARGDGVPRDKSEAVKWFRAAAKTGHAEAQHLLGLMLMYNPRPGTPEDEAEAIEWFRRAAEQGYSLAQANMGELYSEGRGVPQDYQEAIEWYHRSAQQGYALAQYNLGLMYWRGESTPRDDAEGLIWIRRAAEQGLSEAQYTMGRAYLTGRGVAQNEVEALEWFARAAEEGQIVLHTAAEKGDPLVAEFLLANGENPNAKDISGGSPLHYVSLDVELAMRMRTSLAAAGLDLSEVTAENALSGALSERFEELSIDPAVIVGI